MPTPEESKKAGVFDVSEWGEKDGSGAYLPGTMFDLGDGRPPVDVSKLPDVIGGKGKRSKKPRAKAPRGRAPERPR